MKKGFTLIELLAVIVILAIIALIAIPIVIHIIDDTKKSSEEQSIKLYLDTVTKTITKQNLKSKYEPDTCVIQNTGNIICQKNNEDLMVEGRNKILHIDTKGTKPSEGTIYFNNGKITKINNIKYKDLYYQIKDGNVSNGTRDKKLLITKVYLADLTPTGAGKIKNKNGNEYSVTTGNYWRIPYVEGIHIVTGTNKAWVPNNYLPFIIETTGQLIAPEYTSYEDNVYFEGAYKYETTLTGYDSDSTIYINTDMYLKRSDYREYVYYEIENK